MGGTTTTGNNDPLLAAANTAWLEYARGTWSETDRRVFMAGWEAAMKYAASKAAEGIEHLDSDDCCHFQD